MKNSQFLRVAGQCDRTVSRNEHIIFNTHAAQTRYIDARLDSEHVPVLDDIFIQAMQ
ncbi:hypothetical protein D3C87_1781290 [compost metagenome]